MDVANLIHEYHPDIIALQEGSHGQTYFLKHSLPEYDSFSSTDVRTNFPAIFFQSDRFLLIAAGLFWLVENSKLPGGNRRCSWVRLRDSRFGRSIYVYNLHLDHRSRSSREKRVINLVSQIRNRNFKDPVLVMGDFNAVENSRSISYLKGEVPLQDHTGQSRLNDISLVDTVRAILPNAKYLGTTHGFTGNRDRERLDYIFVSEGFEVQNAMIVRKSSNGRYPSDHFPVIADLKLR